MPKTFSAVTLMLVLVVAVQAGGEAACAWVLWEYTRRGDGKQEWRVLSAVSSRGDCEAEGRARATRELHVANPDDNFGDLTGVFCLPDTVDPRGPKGDGR